MTKWETVKTGIFEMLQRNTWKDIDDERRRFQPVLNDALKLLKEQQPRVLTYDEMKTMIGKPVYVEEPKRNADPHCCWGLVVEGEEPPKEGGYNYPGGVDFNVEVGLDAYDGDLYMVDIGCGWRAWTAEPTDEQRMNTPWEGR